MSTPEPRLKQLSQVTALLHAGFYSSSECTSLSQRLFYLHTREEKLFKEVSWYSQQSEQKPAYTQLLTILLNNPAKFFSTVNLSQTKKPQDRTEVPKHSSDKYNPYCVIL